MNTHANPLTSRPTPLLLSKSRNRPAGPPPLGQILVEMGALSPGDLIKAIALRSREDAKFGRIMLANNMITEHALAQALAVQFGCEVAELRETPPDVRLIDEAGPDVCLKQGIVPWKRIGGITVVVTARPESFDEVREKLPDGFGHILMAVAPEAEIQRALLVKRQRKLALHAETRVTLEESCRGWQTGAMGRFALAGLFGVIACMITAPRPTFTVICAWAVVALILNTVLKVSAAISTLRASRSKSTVFTSNRNRQTAMKLPTVSIMVALYREREIAARLILRLARLTYPRELLDICLIVEEDDTVTQSALTATNLPSWMRQITVPRGALKTKPRALNYALDFCRGSIIGVYDAEDAPEPDQIYKIARRFHERGPEVACLQGILDFYNPRANWLARCFTIEYATWFRVVLPGLERMGLVVPLGGTTLFFRRDALEKLGGWDAHNVTEDADLGIRLARHGYRTELIATVTEEEANCRYWPWVKQRSRWLKGYAMTWIVHMRSPTKLWRDLGAWRFFGVQVVFLGTLSQFLLAPFLWAFWAVLIGLPHPLDPVLSREMFFGLTGIFLLTEILSFAVGVYAVSRKKHMKLWPWVITMHLYFPLGALAAYKAFWELIVNPFYWDKTAHGLSANTRKKKRFNWRRSRRLQGAAHQV